VNKSDRVLSVVATQRHRFSCIHDLSGGWVMALNTLAYRPDSQFSMKLRTLGLTVG